VITANPPSPSMFGQMVTFTATVTGANGGSPTGMVSFSDGTNPISGCTGVALAAQANGSTATCPTSALALGQHTIGGTYSGDSNFTAGNGSIPYQVNQATTVVSLSLNPTSATAGQVVTLTATITANSTPVPNGTVSFLSGTSVLGTVQVVTASGMATLRTRFGPGTYSLTAHYNGTNSYGPATSPAQPLTVTGTEPTISTLTATSDGSNYDFGLSVFGFGFPPSSGAMLTGSAPLNNVTQGGSLLGTIQVPGGGMSGFQTPASYPAGTSPHGIAVGDFNGDGFPDLAVVNDNGNNVNAVSILLGNGDGSFRPPPTYQTGLGPFGVVVADFNGDGIADLVVTNSDSDNVGIFLGNGDGTFQPQQTYAAGHEPLGIVVGDFNRDGIADLAVVDFVDRGVSILLGNGDGTFQAPQQSFAVGHQPLFITTADFNGDGIADLAITNQLDGTVSVLLGNGDGTFRPQQTYAVGQTPAGIATADLNGDGFADLVVANTGGGTVGVLLGNGDGTFRAQQTYPTSPSPYGIAIADFNGDGISDLAVTFLFQGISVLLGNGDGTFQPQQVYQLPQNSAPEQIVTADFNGDGVPDLAAADVQSNQTSVLLGGTVSTGTLNNIPVYGTGNQNIQASFTPNGTFYAASQSSQVTVAGTLIPTTTVVTSSQNPSTYLQPVTFTATVTAMNGGSPTGTVTFTMGTNTICSLAPLTPATNGSVATCQTANLPVGTDRIVAISSGDSSYASSQSPPFMQTVNPAPMIPTATTLTSSPDPSTFHQPVTFTATVGALDGSSPTGTVTFAAGTTIICSNVALVQQQGGSVANCMTATLAIGSHSIVAIYSPTGNYSASQSQPLTQVVDSGAFNGTLSGGYAFTFSGYSFDQGALHWLVVAGSFVTDGKGNVTGGEFDQNEAGIGAQHLQITGGSYAIGANGLGGITLDSPGGRMGQLLVAAADAQDIRIIGFNQNGISGSWGAGLLRQQNPSAFNHGALAGNWAFGEQGFDSAGNPLAIDGAFQLDSSGNKTGAQDLNDAGNSGQETITGHSTSAIDSSGRFTEQLQISGGIGTVNKAEYVVSANEMVGIRIDRGAALFVSDSLRQTGTLNNSILNGSSVARESRQGSNAGSQVNVANVALATFDGHGNYTFTEDTNQGGTMMQQTTKGSYSVASNGRTLLGGSPVCYVVQQNEAFCIEIGSQNSDPGVFFVEPQAAGPFNTATLSGMYLGGSLPQYVPGNFDQIDYNLLDGLGGYQSIFTQSGPNGTSLNQTLAATYAVDSTGGLIISENGLPIYFGYIVSPNKFELISNDNNPRVLVEVKSGTAPPPSGDFTVSASPGSITLPQGYSNATAPFFSQTIHVTVAPVNGYSNTVTLSCSLSPPLTGGSCTVNSPTSGLVDANLTTTLTVDAGLGSPIGQYMVIVTGQDSNGLMHQTSQQLMVINSASGVSMPPGGGGSTMVYFPGPPGTPIGNFMCSMVSGTGLTGNQPLSSIGGNCTFTPTSGTIPGPIMLTISGCTVARLHTRIPIYATFFFSLPGLVLLGPLAVRGRRRKRMLQAIGMLLVVCAVLLAAGCGGYGQLSPTGNYQVLVQGTAPDGTVYSAVVPVTVTPLH